MKTKERLANAIRELYPQLTEIIDRAESGYYDDYESPHAFPLTQLVKDLNAAKAFDLAQRAMNGEFDGTETEAMAWFEREGQYLLP